MCDPSSTSHRVMKNENSPYILDPYSLWKTTFSAPKIVYKHAGKGALRECLMRPSCTQLLIASAYNWRQIHMSQRPEQKEGVHIRNLAVQGQFSPPPSPMSPWQIQTLPGQWERTEILAWPHRQDKGGATDHLNILTSKTKEVQLIISNPRTMRILKIHQLVNCGDWFIILNNPITCPGLQYSHWGCWGISNRWPGTGIWSGRFSPKRVRREQVSTGRQAGMDKSLRLMTSMHYMSSYWWSHLGQSYHFNWDRLNDTLRISLLRHAFLAERLQRRWNWVQKGARVISADLATPPEERLLSKFCTSLQGNREKGVVKKLSPVKQKLVCMLV